ncbi:DNA repair protein Rad50, partial [Campylobacter jejuni]|nr:DNA repair protein Rad50 [Campylobacter jejuni]EDP4080270.1 DNA repair protein Rad50 [Campylobacter jejuni]EDP5777574.1 DNA repair protein Rad50 [Campylobacter jejuni]EDP5868494.1 DNA repair protein Rad50 [Campylobacter jejuni]EDP6726724.1 DNA repair protein Rad50 [Campylobacter jejuni]
DVNVNLYFDDYDKNYPSTSIILAMDKSYYITSFNVDNFDEKNQYLDKIPDPILNLIKDENNKLTSFYNEMRKRIKEDNFQNISYSSDIVFNNTMQYNKNKENGNPFFHYIRAAVMTPEHFKKLFHSMNISKEILMKIQQAGFTIVTTNDPNKRKNFYEELKSKEIFIEVL